MRGKTRFVLLLAAAVLLASGAVFPARAEVMTLGVWLRGQVTDENGTTALVPLEGVFQVLQGGLDKGSIQAGENTVTLEGPASAVLEPVAELFPAGWDLSAARIVVPFSEGNVMVPILVPLAEQSSGAAVSAAAEEPDRGTGADGGDGSGEEIPAAGATPLPRLTALPTEAPDVLYTPVPTEAVTPVPAIGTPEPSAETGTFRILAFQDGNLNGEQGIYEKGISGVDIYIVTAEGEIVTGGATGADGGLTLSGVASGTYRIRVVLPEQWTFSRKSKQTGLTSSCTDFSSAEYQDSDPVSLKAGETAERGVSLIRGVQVSGTVWMDENADGIMNDGEPKIAGARVTMTGQKNGLVYETYTDASGNYLFLHVRPGFYDLTGYAPEGMMFTRYSKTGGARRSILTAEGKTKASKMLDLNEAKNAPNQNIGYAWSGSVSGICFLDANYNGIWDDGDMPFAGVKVTAIKQSKDEEIAVAWSGEDGRYTLNGLRGNTYKIRAVLPEDGSNFTLTVSEEEGNHYKARENRRENFITDFVLEDGGHRTVNVGAIYYGSISGTAYLDNDFSATLSGGEKVAKGVEVTLLDAGGRTVETKKTGDKGTYSFTGLTPGTYSLRMTALDGYAFTKAGEGNVVLNLTGGQGYSEPITVPIGTDVTGMDAGMIRPGTVKGTVFADMNDNGLQDAGERGLEGAVVRLMSGEGEAFSARIDGTGAFLFDAVMPGRYAVRYEMPAAAVFARTVPGGNTFQGEDGTAETEWFDFRTADQREMPLCGGLTLGRISGMLFRDHDGSGTQDSGDSPLAGASLVLTPERTDLEPVRADTGEDGSFALTELRPGKYILELTLPENTVTARMTETDLPLAAGRNSQSVSLPVEMGQTWDRQMLGAAEPAVLRGRVWLDENNNGLLEEEEQTPAGYALKVTDELTGELFETLKTDDSGRFEMKGMVPGCFAVSFALTEEMTDARTGDSTFERQGSAMVMSGIVLTEGSSREDLRLGLVRYTSLGGKAWVDRGEKAAAAAEAAALKAAQEAASGSRATPTPAATPEPTPEPEKNRMYIENLPGVRISLLNEEGVTVQSAVTGDNGAWRMSGLMPGIYTLRAEFPEGLLACEPDDERLETGLVSVMARMNGSVGETDSFELKMGQDQLSLNVGSVLPGTIGDYCWLDENRNGWQDGGELGIPHVRVELVRNGVTVAETETDQYGLYFFREVYPAVYSLKVTAPAEVKPTRKRTDIPLISSSLLETEGTESWTESLEVQSDYADFNVDLGFVLRKQGVFPAGYGEQETMDWSKTYTDKSGK